MRFDLTRFKNLFLSLLILFFAIFSNTFLIFLSQLMSQLDINIKRYKYLLIRQTYNNYQLVFYNTLFVIYLNILNIFVIYSRLQLPRVYRNNQLMYKQTYQCIEYIGGGPFRRRRFGAGQLGTVPIRRRTFGCRFLIFFIFRVMKKKQ